MKFSPNNKYINENHLQRQSLWKEPLIRNSLPNKMMKNLKGTNLELPMCLLDWIDKNKIVWNGLSQNPNAIDLLKENPDKIDWQMLSFNPNAEAIALLKENPDEIDWNCLSSNPNIFTYDYEKMRENMLLFKEDLMKERFHPRNLRKFSSWGHSGGIDDDDD